jgi:hypothetical protein
MMFKFRSLASFWAGVAQSVHCLITVWANGVRCLAEENYFFSLCVQDSSEAHPASCTMATGGKARPGRDADHTLPFSTEVENE